MDKHLHIVSFNVPWPADYGGVIDVFYKIRALHQLGVKIHLHCFEYGRGEQPELEKYCEEVIYYHRKTGLAGVSITIPYIVNSRSNKELLENLLKDDHPILLEGIHCTYFISDHRLRKRKIVVRLHNAEFEYYDKLAGTERSLFKKMYFRIESNLLKHYEFKIAGKTKFACLSKNDAETYRLLGADAEYLPVFLPGTTVTSKHGKGNYCLYHGNLSVAENEKAASWLADILEELDIPFIIAGKDPSKNLKKNISKKTIVSLVENPSSFAIDELVSNAQVNILPSFNSTGIKIKIVYALLNGRHCLVNKNAVDNSVLEPLCRIFTDDIAQKIDELFLLPFIEDDILKRRNILEKEFDNTANAEKLMQWIY